MKHLFSLMLFFGISVLGDFISNITRIPVPGNILGMIMLFVLLCLKVVKLEDIKKTGTFLIDNMLLFILPSAVGIIATYYMVADKIVLYVLMNIITTILVFIVTAYSAQGLIKIREKRQAKSELNNEGENKL